MEDTNTTTEEIESTPPAVEDFVRPVSGRMIAGVAQGLANRFNIPTWLVRIGFVVTCFIGGLGLVAYLAAWGLVRSEDEPESATERFFASNHSASSWVGVGIIVIGAMILLGNIAFFSGEFLWAAALITIGALLYTGYINGPSGTNPPQDSSDDKEGVQQVTPSDTLVVETKEADGDSPSGGSPTPPPTPTPMPVPPSKPREPSILGRLTVGLTLLGMGVLAILDRIDSIPIDAGPRHYLALAVTIIGVGLIVGAILGRGRWLIIVAVVLVPVLMLSPAFEYDWNSDVFDSLEIPTEFSQLQANYQQDVGNLVIDLTELPWDGETVFIEANVDLGNLELRIPENVSIRGQASVDIGRAAGPGQESVGLGDPTVEFNWNGNDGLVELFLTVDVGNVEVDVWPSNRVTP